jgi:hypothetical protein
MSKRVLLALAVAASLAASSLAGQSTVQLEARVHRLEAKEKVLQDSIELAERERIERRPRRYFTVAGVTFGFPVEVADAAEQALASEGDTWRARYGSALALLSADTVTFLIDLPVDTNAQFATITWRRADLRGESKVLVEDVARGPWMTWLAADVLRKWETSILGAEMQGWLNGSAPPISGGEEKFARTDLLFSHSGPARRCLEGDLRDCERALALKEGADPYTEWYDPADLVALVRGYWDERAPGRASCLATGELAACRTALGGRDRQLLSPTRTEVRSSLYLYALTLGGPAALTRIHAEGDRSPARLLAVGSGVSIDSLVAGWHATLVAPRPGVGVGAAVLALALAALWSTALLGLFAWRFRWHHV